MRISVRAKSFLDQQRKHCSFLIVHNIANLKNYPPRKFHPFRLIFRMQPRFQFPGTWPGEVLVYWRWGDFLAHIDLKSWPSLFHYNLRQPQCQNLERSSAAETQLQVRFKRHLRYTIGRSISAFGN